MDGQSNALPDLSEALSRLMANPELMGAVASALGKAPTPPGPSDSAPEPAPASTAASVSLPSASPPGADLLATLAPLLTTLKGGTPPDNDRSRLLCALKPYVNPHRRDTIDTLLKFSGLSELLKTLR